jgi:hypothetical protein
MNMISRFEILGFMKIALESANNVMSNVREHAMVQDLATAPNVEL